MDELRRARDHHRRGELGAAVAAYRASLQRAGDDVEVLHDCSVALLQSRQPLEAEELLVRALAIAPGRFDLLLALTQAQQLGGNRTAALATAEAATAAAPTDPRGWFLRGRLEAILGANVAAEGSLRRALAAAPGMEEAWHYLGEALQRQARWDEAIEAYREAMRSQPGEIMNIGICAEQAGRWAEALDAYRRMCSLYPGRQDCLARLAQVAAMLCDFDTHEDASRRLVALMEAGPPREGDYPEPFALSFLPIPGEVRRAALRHYAGRIRIAPAAPQRDIRQARTGRVRIGYLGADFGRHAVGTLLLGLFAAHDRSRFEVLGYSLRRHADPVASRLRGEFDVFRDLDGMAATEIAATIRNDRVDVLIDLSGYTRGGRPEVLAMRPAPLQLGWLGFINGHEAPWLDGVVLDAFVQPPEAEWPFSDRIVRLSGLMFPSGPMPAGIPDRERFGLPADVPLMASFNNSYKLDSELLDAWVEIQRRAATAHLAVYLPAQAREGFLRAWRQRGGDPARLHLLDHIDAEAQAARAASCDLFLDAFRYQAGATALASIAAGLPILSREGNNTLARLSAGINRFLGMDELVCMDTEGYIDRAVSLANDRDALRALRARMGEAAMATGLHHPRRAAEALETLVQRLLGDRVGPNGSAAG